MDTALKLRTGLIVEYTINDEEALGINRRREDAQRNRADAMVNQLGYVLHMGNRVVAGERYPMIITRVWPGTNYVNGQVLLDGNDTLWVTSVQQGEGERTFRAYG